MSGAVCGVGKQWAGAQSCRELGSVAGFSDPRWKVVSKTSQWVYRSRPDFKEWWVGDNDGILSQTWTSEWKNQPDEKKHTSTLQPECRQIQATSSEGEDEYNKGGSPSLQLSSFSPLPTSWCCIQPCRMKFPFTSSLCHLSLPLFPKHTCLCVYSTCTRTHQPHRPRHLPSGTQMRTGFHTLWLLHVTWDSLSSSEATSISIPVKQHTQLPPSILTLQCCFLTISACSVGSWSLLYLLHSIANPPKPFSAEIILGQTGNWPSSRDMKVVSFEVFPLNLSQSWNQLFS